MLKDCIQNDGKVVVPGTLSADVVSFESILGVQYKICMEKVPEKNDTKRADYVLTSIEALKGRVRRTHGLQVKLSLCPSKSRTVRIHKNLFSDSALENFY